MVESKNSTKKTLTINIGGIIKIIVVPDQLKTKRMCKNAVTDFLNDIWLNKSVIRLIWKILEWFLTDYYKSKKLRDKDVDCYSHVLEFVTDCYNTKV